MSNKKPMIYKKRSLRAEKIRAEKQLKATLIKAEGSESKAKTSEKSIFNAIKENIIEENDMKKEKVLEVKISQNNENSNKNKKQEKLVFNVGKEKIKKEKKIKIDKPQQNAENLTNNQESNKDEVINKLAKKIEKREEEEKKKDEIIKKLMQEMEEMKKMNENKANEIKHKEQEANNNNHPTEDMIKQKISKLVMTKKSDEVPFRRSRSPKNMKAISIRINENVVQRLDHYCILQNCELREIIQSLIQDFIQLDFDKRKLISQQILLNHEQYSKQNASKVKSLRIDNDIIDDFKESIVRLRGSMRDFVLYLLEDFHNEYVDL